MITPQMCQTNNAATAAAAPTRIATPDEDCIRGAPPVGAAPERVVGEVPPVVFDVGDPELSKKTNCQLCPSLFFKAKAMKCKMMTEGG